MGNPRGFIEHKRKEAGYRPVKERLKDYKDVTRPLSKKDIEIQASRCMDCGVPFCHAIGCPIHNFIPEWNDLVYKGRWKEALSVLEKTNPLPEITGRVCPAPCESSCTLSINDSPVTIRQVELAIIEQGFKNNWVKAIRPVKEIKKRIAIVGSGPAGLAGAWILRQKGYAVTVFEKSNKIGGILRFGIPDFKLEKGVIKRRVNLMKESGIKFRIGVEIGEDISAAYLRKSYDIVLLAIGAGVPRNLGIPGRKFKGIHYAMEYLNESNILVSGNKWKKGLISAGNKNVLVIGGGDTGSDCVGTANRQGAKSVYLYEIMPKPRDWKNTWNPQWPDWPLMLRKSSSHKEGVNRDWSVSVKEFKGKNGNVKEACFKRVEWEKPKNGKRMKLKELPGGGFTMKVDLVLLAMGFLHVEHNKLLGKLGIGYDERGNIKTDGNFSTNVKGVFSAGDASRGASLVVHAINQGKLAAEKISEYLRD